MAGMTPQATEIFNLVQAGYPLAPAIAFVEGPAPAAAAPTQVADLTPAQSYSDALYNDLYGGNLPTLAQPTYKDFNAPGVDIAPASSAPGGGWVDPVPDSPGTLSPLDPQPQPLLFGPSDVFTS